MYPKPYYFGGYRVYSACFLKESVLGGDAFWWVYLQGCFQVVMVYRLYAAPFVSYFVHNLRLAEMAFNNICRFKKKKKTLMTSFEFGKP